MSMLEAHGLAKAIYERQKEKARMRAAQREVYRLKWANRLSSDPSDIEGTRTGGSVKELKNWFEKEGGAYNYAIIERIKDGAPMATLVRRLSNKFKTVPADMR